MGTALLFINRAKNGERLKLLLIKHAHEKFGVKACMDEWVAAGNLKEEWKYSFTKIVITDREPEELQYLFDTDEAGDRIWQFIEPAKGSADYEDLVELGGMVRMYDEVIQYLAPVE